MAVLSRLREAHGYVSGEVLSRTLSVSRNVVWRCVQALREYGYQIASAPHRGYHLEANPDTPYPWELAPLLTTQYLGRTSRYVDRVDSTNRLATELARAGAPNGSIVVTDTQTAGRGRLGRQWFSPPACNLYVSIILRPQASPWRVPQTALVAALALAEAGMEVVPELAVAVKWPNDLFVAGRKVAGILCEMAAEPDRVHHLVIGVGVNANLRPKDLPAEVADSATSLRAVTGRSVSRLRLLAGFLNHLERALSTWHEQGLTPFIPTWQRLSLLRGKAVRIETGREVIRGRVRGLSTEGGLVLETEAAAARVVLSGDTHIEDWHTPAESMPSLPPPEFEPPSGVVPASPPNNSAETPS